MLSITIRVISKKRSYDFLFLCPLASDTSAIDASCQVCHLQFIVIRKHYGLEGNSTADKVSSQILTYTQQIRLLD